MIKGIDVSRWQGVINFAQVKQSGVYFVYVKCTEGLTLKDPKFATNAIAARAHGLQVGAYHFANPHNSGKAEAEFFLHTLSATMPNLGDLLPVLDIETEGFTTEQIHQYITDFCSVIEPHLNGRHVVIYTYTSYYKEHDLAAFGSDHAFWIADYSKECGIPGWSIWQYSETGSVPGINGHVDLDQAPKLDNLLMVHK